MHAPSPQSIYIIYAREYTGNPREGAHPTFRLGPRPPGVKTTKVIVYEEGGKRVAFLTAFTIKDYIARLFRYRAQELRLLERACELCPWRGTEACPSLGGEGPCYLDKFSRMVRSDEEAIARHLKRLMKRYNVQRIWGVGVIDGIEISFDTQYPPVSYWLSRSESQ